jgi:alpha-mannosidase
MRVPFTLFPIVLIANAAVIAAPSPSPQVDHVWVVFKTHFDIGYTAPVGQVLAKYRGPMVDKALRLIEKNRQMAADERFVWTLPGWPLARIMDDEQTAPRREQVRRALMEGSLAVHALPFSMHTESLDLEDLVRGLHFSSQIARDLGKPLPIAAKMTDVPSHSWVLPTLLAHAGIRFLHLGCNAGSQYPRVPPLFWWQGADGSRVLCCYTPQYGSPPTPSGPWPAKNYLAMIMEGDNHGPPTPEEVESVRRQIAARLPSARVTFGTLDDFAKAIEAEKPDLEIVRGDMPDTWIHGLMSNPIETGIARNVRPLEPALETLDSELRAWGCQPAPCGKALTAAYENSLLYGEHTWGSNGSLVGNHYGEDWKRLLAAGHYDKWLKTFEDKCAYIRTTERIIHRELGSRLRLLAQGVNEEGKRIVIYNPLPWPRTELVHYFPGESDDGWLPIGPDGAIEEFVFLAKEVPANGYTTYRVTAKDRLDSTLTKSADVKLDTRFYRVTFDLKRGAIASLVEKASGRELVDQSSPYALGQYLHERFSLDQVNAFLKAYTRVGGWARSDFGKEGMPAPDKSPYAAITPSGWLLYVQHHALFERASLAAADTKGLARDCAIEFTFSRQEPTIEVRWTILKKTPNPIPEGGWLCFPFAAEQPHFTLGRLGAPVDPVNDIVPGTNRYLGAVSSGVAITGANQAGIALCPLDSPLVSLDQPGLWKWSMDFTPRRAAVFVNLYNNMWNTNFRFWQEGTWSERVRIWPLGKGTGVAENLAVKSWEARLPLQVGAADGPGGRLPTSQSGVALSRRGVLVTAFGPDSDGNPGTLLRVWDQSGVSGPLTITLPAGLKAAHATPVDLRGQAAGRDIALHEGRLEIDLPAYAPASFDLK